MKKYFTLKNIIIFSAAFLGLLIFFLSFAVQAELRFDTTIKFVNSVWGATEGRIYGGDQLIKSIPLNGGISSIPIVGFILVLVGSISAVLVALFLKKPWAKWVVVGCGALVLVGGVLQFFGGESACAAYAKLNDVSVSEAKAVLKEQGIKAGPGPLGVVLGIFSILVGGAFAGSQFLPEKK